MKKLSSTGRNLDWLISRVNVRSHSSDHSITFWKNGFSVDDGPLRDHHDAANMAFLSDINQVFLFTSFVWKFKYLANALQGRVPQEFDGEQDPYVSIISRATEDFKA